jgi:asparagine synthase (glutamine-hydrolysing)
MCGLFGIFAPWGVEGRDVERGIAALRHRGPDAAGTWTSACRRVAFGHARLSIIDLSGGANQPMRSPDGRWSLIFNGEIVNYRDVRARYRGPWAFRTSGDSEVLLATFAERGPAAMHDWVGMFAFAVFDGERRVLTLGRDRFGIKPLYMVDLPGGGLAFASEIPPLLPHLARVAADDDVIRTYLETGLYDHCERTFFKGVTALPQGCVLEIDIDTGVRRLVRWYDLREHLSDIGGASVDDVEEECARRIEAAIRDHLVADVRAGLNVSGGVDSSVLVGVARRYVEDIQLFTQDYDPPYSEAKWVREVADGCDLHVLTLDVDAITAVLGETVRAQAEPFGGVTVCGYAALYAQARRAGVTVLLDGNGVDEVFLGYAKYAALVEAGGARGGGSVGLSIDGSYGLRPQAIGPGLARARGIRARDPDASWGDAARCEALQDLLSAKIPRGLRFNDRMSMQQSRELRVPFLDHRLVEFGCALPTSLLLEGGVTKALFRRVAERWIPPVVARAQKRSVQSPQREWLGRQMQRIVRDVLEAPSFAERRWVDARYARSALDDYVANGADNAFFIWQWLNLELWAREFLD